MLIYYSFCIDICQLNDDIVDDSESMLILYDVYVS